MQSPRRELRGDGQLRRDFGILFRREGLAHSLNCRLAKSLPNLDARHLDQPLRVSPAQRPTFAQGGYGVVITPLSRKS